MGRERGKKEGEEEEERRRGGNGDVYLFIQPSMQPPPYSSIHSPIYPSNHIPKSQLPPHPQFRTRAMCKADIPSIHPSPPYYSYLRGIGGGRGGVTMTNMSWKKKKNPVFVSMNKKTKVVFCPYHSFMRSF